MNSLTGPITIAITGASGTVYGLRILQFLLDNNYKIDFVISESASKVAKEEINLELSTTPEILREQVLSYFTRKSSKMINNAFLNVWAHNDISASISSGSYRSLGMIIVPASMGTIASIACGTSDNLITRAGDVCLKEKRKLVLVPREMPFNSIHLENLLKLSKNGAVIAPACPGFYHNPKELNELVDFVCGKILDLFGIDHNLFKRWREDSSSCETPLFTQ